jgi:hypothetical protein
MHDVPRYYYRGGREEEEGFTTAEKRDGGLFSCIEGRLLIPIDDGWIAWFTYAHTKQWKAIIAGLQQLHKK